MGGDNPYIEEASYELPTEPYEITLIVEETGEEKVVTVDPASLPYGHEGLPGSILDIALSVGIEMDHACGGVVACSTCHVIVREGADSANEATEDEEDQLDNAPGLTPNSRLGCQCVPNGTAKVVAEIPRWNRNNVQEEH